MIQNVIRLYNCNCTKETDLISKKSFNNRFIYLIKRCNLRCKVTTIKSDKLYVPGIRGRDQ